jgi:hypothetical protein
LAIDSERVSLGGGDAGDPRALLGVTPTAYVCSGCGYGIAVRGHLPSCPMCGGDAWQPEPYAVSALRRPHAGWPHAGWPHTGP